MRASLAFLLPLAATATATAVNALTEPSFADGVTPTPIFEDVTDAPITTVISSTSTDVASSTVVDTSIVSTSTTTAASRRRKGKGCGGNCRKTKAAVVTQTELVFTTFYRTVTASHPSSTALSSVASSSSVVATNIATSFTTPAISSGATGINSFSSAVSATSTTRATSSAVASGLPADILTSYTTPNLSPGATGINPSFASGETPEPILVLVTDDPTSAAATASDVPTTTAVANSTASTSAVASGFPNKLETTLTALPSGITTGVNPTFSSGVTPIPILVPVTEIASGVLVNPDDAITSVTSSALTTTSVSASTEASSAPLGTGATGINPTFSAGETPTPILVPVDSEPTFTARSTTATATLPLAALPTASNGTECKLPRDLRDAHRKRREQRAEKRERKARRAVKRVAKAARMAKRAILQESNAIQFG